MDTAIKSIVDRDNHPMDTVHSLVQTLSIDIVDSLHNSTATHTYRLEVLPFYPLSRYSRALPGLLTPRH